MLLLSMALAQSVTHVAWHGHETSRASERAVVDQQLVAVRANGERAWLERYDDSLEPIWSVDLELPPSAARRHAREAFPVLHAGGALVVVVPMADSLAALVHDPETGERLQTRKLADYGSVNRIDLLVSDEALALLNAETATLWTHDLAELGQQTSSGSWRALDGQTIVRAWSSNGRMTVTNGAKRVEFDAPANLVSARLVAGDGRAWVVGTLRGEDAVWSAHVDFASGLLWSGLSATPERPRMLDVRLIDDGALVLAESGEDTLVVALAGRDAWRWTSSLHGQGPAVVLDCGLVYDGRLRSLDLSNGALGGDAPLLPGELGAMTAPTLVGDDLVTTTRRDLMVRIDLDALPSAPAGLAGSTLPDTDSRAYRAGQLMGSGFDTAHHGAAMAGFAAAAVPTAAAGGGLGAGLGVLSAGAVVGVSTRWAPRPPPTVWANLPPDFQQGYLDAYDRAVRKRQAGWALAGGGVGLLTGLVVGANPD